MTTDEYVVEALRTGLSRVQAWVMYRTLIGTRNEAEFASAWEFWMHQITPSAPSVVPTAPGTAELERLRGRVEELSVRLARAEEELRSAFGTLKMQDDALFVAEHLLAQYDEPRSRYEIATGKHLKAA